MHVLSGNLGKNLISETQNSEGQGNKMDQQDP